MQKRALIFGTLSPFLICIMSACASLATAPANAPSDDLLYAYEPPSEEAAQPEAPIAQSDARAGVTGDGAAVDESSAEGQPIDRLIIRNGNIIISVDNTREARDEIESMVQQMAGEGAFVVSTSEYSSYSDSPPTINMTIRVPAAQFDKVMDQIAGLSVEVINRSETGEDVTAEYVDLSARLESLEAARDRLLEIIENSQTTEDLLLAEQQLTQREAEIESIKGRLQYLSQSARLSSIVIELRPYILSQPIDNRWRPAETVRRAFEDLIDSFEFVAEGLITFGVFCLPWIVIVTPFGYGAYRLGRFLIERRRNRKAEAAAAAQQQESEEV